MTLRVQGDAVNEKMQKSVKIGPKTPLRLKKIKNLFLNENTFYQADSKIAPYG